MRGLFFENRKDINDLNLKYRVPTAPKRSGWLRVGADTRGNRQKRAAPGLEGLITGHIVEEFTD